MTDTRNIVLPEENKINKDILRPVTKKDQYKQEDLIKIHEFKRENIILPFEEIGKKDFFAYTNDDDPKYDFMKVKNLIRSKLMIKALLWSMGIGSTFFLHRYYRKKQILPAIRLGFNMMVFSFFLLWGSFELQPHIMAWYYTKFMESMSANDLNKTVNNYYLESKQKEAEMLEQIYRVKTNNEMNVSDGLVRVSLEYDNEILKRFKYNPMKLDVIKKETEEEDMYSDDFDENKIFNLNQEEDNREEYDFEKLKYIRYNIYCNVDIKKFISKENSNLSKEKYNVLKGDVLSNKNILQTDKYLKDEIINAEKYINGNYSYIDFSDDPDYKRF
jgi:hypothetical protein